MTWEGLRGSQLSPQGPEQWRSWMLPSLTCSKEFSGDSLASMRPAAQTLKTIHIHLETPIPARPAELMGTCQRGPHQHPAR